MNRCPSCGVLRNEEQLCPGCLVKMTLDHAEQRWVGIATAAVMSTLGLALVLACGLLITLIQLPALAAGVAVDSTRLDTDAELQPTTREGVRVRPVRAMEESAERAAEEASRATAAKVRESRRALREAKRGKRNAATASLLAADARAAAARRAATGSSRAADARQAAEEAARRAAAGATRTADARQAAEAAAARRARASK